MKIRFLSSVPCALTIGGEYFGITDDFERFAEISLKDNLFACFSPQNALPLGVFLNDRLFFSPPEGVEAYLLRDGAALYARDFPPRSSEVRITAQERFVSDLITVYFQGGLHVSLETAKGFSVAPLAHYYEHATIKKRDGLFFIEGNNALCIFNASGKKLFDGEILSYRAEKGTLHTISPFRSGAALPCFAKQTDGQGAGGAEAGDKPLLHDEWAVTEDDCYLIGRTATGGKASAHEAYDFFERYRLGLDVTDFLAKDLADKKEELSAFLGDISYVFPCDDENECGVLRKKGERVFEADYFRAEYDNGRICDLKKT